MKLKLKDLLPLQEQNIDSKDPGADPFQKLYDKQNPNDPKAIPGKHFPSGKVVKLKMSNIEDEVTINQKVGSCKQEGSIDKCLDDVTISWGNESHTVSFEYDDKIDDDENSQTAEYEFVAESNDGKWQFILDVVGHINLPSGQCNPCIGGMSFHDSDNMSDEGYDWDELIIQDHPDDESHLDPEDRSDYDDEDNEQKIADVQADIDSINEGMIQERFQKLAGIIKN